METSNLKQILQFLMLGILVASVIFLSVMVSRQKQEKEKVLKIEQVQKEAEIKTYLLGKFDQSKRAEFILVPSQYLLDKNKIYLRKETYYAFLNMHNAAKQDDIDLKIVSATRNFDYQKDIWNKKWSGATLVDGKNLSKSILDGRERFKKILEYSAAPGTSRHHWGTDIDINGVNPPYFNSQKGKREYTWLVKNASIFGFCQTYNKKGAETPDGRKTGYNEEKWHWSYLPISRGLMQEYKNLIKEEDIKGFLGDEYAPNLNLINDYVLSINPDCV
jgi:D-alanyl-D-alanine carboxypeptidase